ncbi:MAG TPA: hypothetical protein VII23_21215 [Terriglobales bacterium]
MTDSSADFTPTDLIAAAAQVLTDGGYHEIPRRFQGWDTPSSRLFENEYNIVGVVVFGTCGELLQTWPDLQGSLVDVISRHIGREESKAWDGYLVLLSPGVAPSSGTAIDNIRYDTTRVRKLVATGDDLRNPTDVERVVRPLLPLSQERGALSHESALDLLPRLLEAQDIPMETTQVLVDAFREQLPLLERLHQMRGEQ